MRNIIIELIKTNSINDNVIEILKSIESAFHNLHPDIIVKNLKSKLEQNKKQIFVCTGKNAYSYALALKDTIDKKYINKIWVFQNSGYVNVASDPGMNIFSDLTHPIPSRRNIEATNKFLSNIEKSGFIYHFFITGGTSSVFCIPEKGVDIDVFVQLNEIFVRSGYKIEEINFFRQLIDGAKGGKAGYLFPKNSIKSWIVSDVPSDDLRAVGSGITVAPISSSEEMIETFKEICNGILSEKITNSLIDLHRINEMKDPLPSEIIVSRHDLLNFTVESLLSKQIKCTILNSSLEGDFSTIGEELSWFIDSDFSSGIFICAGEWTVKVPNDSTGEGGRLSHLLTYLSLLIQSKCTIIGLATDGRDGNTQSNFYLLEAPVPASKKKLARASIKNYDTHKFVHDYGKTAQFYSGLNLMDLIIFIKDE